MSGGRGWYGGKEETRKGRRKWEGKRPLMSMGRQKASMKQGRAIATVGGLAGVLREVLVVVPLVQMRDDLQGGTDNEGDEEGC